VQDLGSNPLGESSWVAVALGFLVLKSTLGSDFSTVSWH